MFYVEGKTAKEVAEAFGYTHRGFTSIVTDFKKKLRNNDGDGLFFKPVQKGRKTTEKVIEARDIVVELRKSYHSVEEIKVVFDSKFTNYENLKKLDDNEIKFVTIRRRGKNIIDRLEQIPAKSKKTIRVEMAGNKKRSLTVLDEEIHLKGYGGTIRQISITGHGKIKPALIITNDFDLKVELIVRKYTKRWIVEKTISEQIEFFHLNLVSSSMVIKVDFDLTMSILTHNLFRLFALDLERYLHISDQSLFDKFLLNTADIEIENDKIKVFLKKKRNLPVILEIMQKFASKKYEWLGNMRMEFYGASYS